MKKMNLIILFTSAFLWFSCSSDEITENTNYPEKETMHNQATNPAKYLALGDSYTIGESVGEDQRFPVQLVKMLNDNGIKSSPATIIAKTGWTTNDLTTGIKNSGINEKFDLVTLLIGVNNQYQGRDTTEYRIQFRQLLQTAILFVSGNEEKLIVVSIPDYGVTPFGKSNEEKIAAEIDIFNKINKEETENVKANYVYITSISRVAKVETSLIAPDGLHPSGEMYRLWVENIFPVAKLILNNR